MPGRPDALRRRRRHPARHRLEPDEPGAAGLGHRRRAGLERRLEDALVRHPPLLRVPREQDLQDAHPRALVEVPQLHALRHLRRRAAQAGIAALAPGREGRGRCGAGAGEALPASRRGLVARAVGGPARPEPARPDADADRAAAAVLRHARPALAAARRRAGAAAGRDPPPAEIPLRRRPGLSDAGPPEPHALRRRGAAHQPDHRPGHQPGQHALRAGRAVHRPAPARHGPHQPGDGAAARRRQHAGGRRARPGGDAGGRPHHRPRPRPRHPGRAHRLRRHARRAERRRDADRRLPRRAAHHRPGPGAAGARQHAAADPGGRAPAQPEERHGRVPAAAAGLRHRRERLGQVDADPGRAGAGAGAPFRPGDRIARRARPPARRRAAHRRGLRRPEPDRQDRALQPGQLCRRLRRGARAVRGAARGAAARLRRRHVQLQRRRRPLPDLRRLGLRACGNAVPLGRLPALPGLRRHPLPRRDPRGAADAPGQGDVDRRRAGADGE